MKTKRFFSLFLLMVLVLSLWTAPHAAALDAQADALLSEYVPKADAVFTQVTKQLRT